MELIKILLNRHDKLGRSISMGLFLCLFCLQKVEKSLSNGKRDKSCGCKQHYYSEERNKKIAENNKGKKRTDEQKKNYSKAFKGKPKSEEHKQKIREKRRLQIPPNKGKTGNLSPAWRGGKSFEIYPQEFNKPLKQLILKRDNYTCQYPGCIKIHNKLHIHHIDYDKKNNNPENLITLCHSCHSKTNGNRQYWTEFYQIHISSILF